MIIINYFSDIYAENRELFEYISANAGVNVTNVVELGNHSHFNFNKN